MGLNISEIRERIYALGALIFAPATYLSLPTGPSSDGSPYIEIVNGSYHYVFSDRGGEFSRKITDDPDRLFYWIFREVASAMAIDYEFKNRVPNLDFRRIKFKKQIEIMTLLSDIWGERVKSEIEEILRSSPYDDMLDSRVELCKKLMSKGMPGDKAYEKACEEFPVP